MRQCNCIRLPLLQSHACPWKIVKLVNIMSQPVYYKHLEDPTWSYNLARSGQVPVWQVSDRQCKNGCSRAKLWTHSVQECRLPSNLSTLHLPDFSMHLSWSVRRVAGGHEFRLWANVAKIDSTISRLHSSFIHPYLLSLDRILFVTRDGVCLMYLQ